MEVVPKSSGERVYNVFVLILGLVVGSTLVATLSAMMTQYRLHLEESTRKMHQLHDFLDQQGVGTDLAMAAKSQIQATLSCKGRLKAKEVAHLSLLSKSMQAELRAQF